MARRNLGGESAWRQRIVAFKKSGVTLSAFAAREGVSEMSVRRWARHFDAEATTRHEPMRLVELVATASRETTRTDFEVMLANGHAIRVPHEFDSERLRALIDVLGSAR